MPEINPELLLSAYDYDLPLELIAQRPADESRLLIYRVSKDEVIHDSFKNLDQYLPPSSLLVFNRSKVFPSRLLGTKKSGGKAEFFILSHTPLIDGTHLVLIKTSSKKKVGDEFCFFLNVMAVIEKILDDGQFLVRFNLLDLSAYLNQYGLIPIPPYIRKGESDDLDKKDYQTIYAKEVGSVAAPTAGLHFKPEILKKLEHAKINSAFVTLHVGLGTFKPVVEKIITDHKMHGENYFIDQYNLELIKNSRQNGSKIIAVGTTSLRVLESSFNQNILPDKIYSTDIFLYPGKKIQSVDGLITNFHLPQSSLLMLVSSFLTRKKTMELYQLAIKERYRFFSYGDAMLVLR